MGVRDSEFRIRNAECGARGPEGIKQSSAFRFHAPSQRVGDLLAGKPSAALGKVEPSYRPGVVLSDLSAFLPGFVIHNIRYALPKLGQRLRGFDDPDALLTGPETRSSAPVRLLRNTKQESAIWGIYPLGEGAGYAGGIVSAAVDGLCAGMEAGI